MALLARCQASSRPPRLACPPGVSAEAGTIAGVASALAMALIGAVSSYISYQQKKFCFSIQRKCAPLRPVKWGAGPPQGDGARPGARAESDVRPDRPECKVAVFLRAPFVSLRAGWARGYPPPQEHGAGVSGAPGAAGTLGGSKGAGRQGAE